MSYMLTLQCGCFVYVSCHPGTGVAHTRIIERRGTSCTIRRHEVGARIYLWEILPEPTRPVDVGDDDVRHNSQIEWI
jgi:hypothetical protein